MAASQLTVSRRWLSSTATSYFSRATASAAASAASSGPASASAAGSSSSGGSSGGSASVPRSYATHEVFNQSTPLEDINVYQDNAILTGLVNRMGGGWANAHLSQFGQKIGSAETAQWAIEAHKYTPTFKSHDRFGRLVSQAEFHPSYHNLMKLGLEAGVSNYAWSNGPKPGAHVVRAALMYMMTWGDPGVCCPMSMTFAGVPALQQQPEVAAEWVPRVTAGQYDPRDIPASQKSGCTMGMSMTEKQGGSDVRANTTRAVPLGKPGPAQAYSITGHKWFTSAPMCDAFLTLAYTDDGLSCFLIPRWLPDGTRNSGFRVMRLKDKMGDKSNASSEVEYSNAYGVMVGEPGRGVKSILNMVVHTRLDCIIGSSALMHHAVRLAAHHVSSRKAFGEVLIRQPAMAAVLADLIVEVEAAATMTFRIAQLFDEAQAQGNDSESEALRRIATAVTKYWVCKRTPNTVYEAMECAGGCGYVEEWVFPRIFRQSPLNSIWEGSGNVICLDVLRAAAREPESLTALMKEVNSVRGADGRLDALLDSLNNTLGSEDMRNPVASQGRIRSLVDRFAVALQATWLLTYGNPDVAELYLATRVGRSGTFNFGSLPTAGSYDSDHSRWNRVIDHYLANAAY